ADGFCRALISLSDYGLFQLCHSDYILAEVAAKLAGPKLRQPRRRIRLFEEFIRDKSRMVHTSGRVYEFIADPKDHAVFETAERARADFLVTYDPHLLVANGRRGIRVARPEEFYAHLTRLGLVVRGEFKPKRP
ncbi:MAG: PIN domain-containing protein, partial [Verrucomicrobia bacterium]|nr:PIN domain-containing protein [Verrucomicrobiota bacterium]